MNKVRFNLPVLAFFVMLLVGISRPALACDACMQAAAESASATMSAAISGTTSAVQANVQATSALATTVSSSTTTITTAINSQTTTFNSAEELRQKQLISAIEAMSAKFEAGLTQNIKVMSNIADHEMASFTGLIKGQVFAEEKKRTEMEFGNDMAQPASGDVGADRAPLFRAALVQNKQLRQSVLQQMYDYNQAGMASSSGVSGVHEINMLQLDAEAFDPIPLVTKNTLSPEEFLYAQQLTMALTNPIPLVAAKASDFAQDSTAAVEYELKRKVWNSQVATVQSVLVDELMFKNPVVDPSWASAYAKPDIETNSGKISVLEMYRADIEGRLSAPGWYLNMRQMSSAGLKREQNYQQATTNAMLLNIFKSIEKQKRLLAIQNSLQLSKEKERIGGM